ncbi:MAG: RNA polymerase sporulation sigma factor SigK [Lachnospiraceae bacterium]
MQSFRQPLSSTQEAEYIALSRAGDKEARNMLIESNLRLVAHIVKKYSNYEKEAEDFISIGTIGLIKAIDTFDSSKGKKLATYASRCVENELLMYLRQKRKTNKEISLFDPIGTDKEGNEISLLDIIESDDPDVIENMYLEESVRKLYIFMNKVLTTREKEILILRYGLTGHSEITQKQIGDWLGISRSYVSRIEKRALLKLKREFDTSG